MSRARGNPVTLPGARSQTVTVSSDDPDCHGSDKVLASPSSTAMAQGPATSSPSSRTATPTRSPSSSARRSSATTASARCRRSSTPPSPTRRDRRRRHRLSEAPSRGSRPARGRPHAPLVATLRVADDVGQLAVGRQRITRDRAARAERAIAVRTSREPRATPQPVARTVARVHEHRMAVRPRVTCLERRGVRARNAAATRAPASTSSRPSALPTGAAPPGAASSAGAARRALKAVVRADAPGWRRTEAPTGPGISRPRRADPPPRLAGRGHSPCRCTCRGCRWRRSRGEATSSHRRRRPARPGRPHHRCRHDHPRSTRPRHDHRRSAAGCSRSYQRHQGRQPPPKAAQAARSPARSANLTPGLRAANDVPRPKFAQSRDHINAAVGRRATSGSPRSRMRYSGTTARPRRSDRPPRCIPPSSS